MPAKPEASLVLLGIITSVHGVRGQVKIKSFMEDPASLFAYSPLLDRTGKKEYRLTKQGKTKDVLIASLDGITSREQAELLKNIELYTHKSRLPKLRKDEFYMDDLVGLSVRVDGTKYGKVKAALNFGAGDILEITPANGGDSELYAFTKAIFPEVDMENGTIDFSPPEVIEAKK